MVRAVAKSSHTQKSICAKQKICGTVGACCDAGLEVSLW